MKDAAPVQSESGELKKAVTGIRGFDEITLGGLPRGRPTLVTGGAGSGKTLFGMEFLVHGAVAFGEPGVFMSFEESEADLVTNFASLGFDLNDLKKEEKIALDYIHIERSEIEETGEYDLEGLFIRLGHAIDAIGAKRVVLDTLEALFSGFVGDFILRAELRRLFRWLKDRKITAVITAERGEKQGSLTRHGIEEYVSDCVVILDHRLENQISTRRLRVAKYRGSSHGTNEYPFLIDDGGLSVLPITSVSLDYPVSSERISTGIPRLDTMFGGGFYRGSSVLVSGTAGTGKTSISACFADQTCRDGERCLYYAFEESSEQIIRNMRSIGTDLTQWVKKGLLHFHNVRPTSEGLEMHLVGMYKMVNDFSPAAIILDPVSNLISAGNPQDVKAVLMRLVDLLKSRMITSLFTSLSISRAEEAETAVGVSSLMDTWIMLNEIESSGERNRGLYIIKSRGMAHSNQIREFLLTDSGVNLLDVYTGPQGVLTGSARIAQQALEEAESLENQRKMDRKIREYEGRRRLLESRIENLRAQLKAEQDEMDQTLHLHEKRDIIEKEQRNKVSWRRMADNAETRIEGKDT
ncbi:MAG: circadian clock protein KaiC [Desulfobacterales bacterium]